MLAFTVHAAEYTRQIIGAADQKNQIRVEISGYPQMFPTSCLNMWIARDDKRACVVRWSQAWLRSEAIGGLLDTAAET